VKKAKSTQKSKVNWNPFDICLRIELEVARKSNESAGFSFYSVNQAVISVVDRIHIIRLMIVS